MRTKALSHAQADLLALEPEPQGFCNASVCLLGLRTIFSALFSDRFSSLQNLAPRLMNPASIKRLTNESQAIFAESEVNGTFAIPAFISSWIAWEALRTRFIRVLIHHKGWMLKDADAVLAKKKIASMAQAEVAITSLGVNSPHHWPKKSAQPWKLLCEIEPLRHRLIHGFKSIDPPRIQAATKVVVSLVSQHQWLEDVPVLDSRKARKGVLVGPLLAAKRSASHTQNQDLQSLARLLEVDMSQGAKKLPSLARLEAAIQGFQI